jgi:hypothetical protein
MGHLTSIDRCVPWCHRLSGTALELLRASANASGNGSTQLQPRLWYTGVAVCAGHLALTVSCRLDQIEQVLLEKKEGHGEEDEEDRTYDALHHAQSTIIMSLAPPHAPPSTAATPRDISEVLVRLFTSHPDRQTSLGGGWCTSSSDFIGAAGNAFPCIVVRHIGSIIFSDFLRLGTGALVFATVDSTGLARFWHWQEQQGRWVYLNYFTLVQSTSSLSPVHFAHLSLMEERGNGCRLLWVESGGDDRQGVWSRQVNFATGAGKADGGLSKLEVGLAVRLFQHPAHRVLCGLMGDWLMTRDIDRVRILLLTRATGRTIPLDLDTGTDEFPLCAVDSGPSSAGELYILGGFQGRTLSSARLVPGGSAVEVKQLCELEEPPGNLQPHPAVSFEVIGNCMLTAAADGHCFCYSMMSGRIVDTIAPPHPNAGADSYLWRSRDPLCAPLLGLRTPLAICTLFLSKQARRDVSSGLRVGSAANMELPCSRKLLLDAGLHAASGGESGQTPHVLASVAGVSGSTLERNVLSFLQLSDAVLRRVEDMGMLREGADKGVEDIEVSLSHAQPLDLAFDGPLRTWLHGGTGCGGSISSHTLPPHRNADVRELLQLTASCLTATSIENLPDALVSTLFTNIVEHPEGGQGQAFHKGRNRAPQVTNAEHVDPVVMILAAGGSLQSAGLPRSSLFDIGCRAFYAFHPELLSSFVSLVAKYIWDKEDPALPAFEVLKGRGQPRSKAGCSNQLRKSLFCQALNAGLPPCAALPMNDSRLRVIVSLHLSAGQFVEGCRFLWATEYSHGNNGKWSIAMRVLEYLSFAVGADERARDGDSHPSPLMLEWRTLYEDMFLRSAVRNEVEHMRSLLRDSLRPPGFGAPQGLLVVSEGIKDAGRLAAIGCSGLDCQSIQSATLKLAMKSLLTDEQQHGSADRRSSPRNSQSMRSASY